MNDNSANTEQKEKITVDDKPAAGREKAILFLVMAVVLLADYASKVVVETNLALNTTWAPISDLAQYFRITHVSNTGAAFGLFPSGSILFAVVAIVVSIFIIIYNQVLPARHQLFRVALGLQLGGAIGNLLSRLRLGHVTDFLDIGPWPVFNVADLCVVTGVIMLGFLMLVEERQRMKEPAESTESLPTVVSQPVETSEDVSMLWND
jgi:signal peptidase II